MRTATVVIGGKEHTVKELQRRKNKGWRCELEKHFEDIAKMLEGVPDVELTDGQALARILRSVGGKLLKSVDILAELVGSYDKSLPLDDAYDSEILDAFGAILGLAYPFGGIVERVQMLAGSLQERTGQSSASASGDAGTIN